MSSLTAIAESSHLRLVMPDESPPASVVRGAAVGHLEAVIDGCVDLDGGLWTVQYARRLADAYGAVGVVHVHPDYLHADLVLPRSQRASPSQDWPRFPHARSARELVTALLNFVRYGESPVRRWLFRMATPRHHASVDALAGCRQWTLVTQSHNGALAGSYTLMRDLLGRDVSDRLQRWSLLAVGCEHKPARDAHVRLSRLLSPHTSLPTPPEFLGNIRQIAPAATRFLGRCDVPRQDWPALVRLVGRLHGHLENAEK